MQFPSSPGMHGLAGSDQRPYSWESQTSTDTITTNAFDYQPVTTWDAQQKRVLVLAAHPDDEVLGVAGTIAKLSRQGYEVHIAILGEGATSRYYTRQPTMAELYEPERDVEQLKTNSEKVAELLGAQSVRHFGLPDNRFDTVPLLEVVKHIEDLVDKLKPEIVYTQHGGDLNIDHVVTHRATLTATRPMQGCSVRSVFMYEVASSTEWAFQQFAPGFQPNVFEDITDTLDLKIRAMQLYELEARKYPHPRSPEALRAQAQHWGSAVGVPAAEAFQLVRRVT